MADPAHTPTHPHRHTHTSPLLKRVITVAFWQPVCFCFIIIFSIVMIVSPFAYRGHGPSAFTACCLSTDYNHEHHSDAGNYRGSDKRAVRGEGGEGA